MNKKLFKLGALTLGLFVAVLMFNNSYTNAATGDVLGKVELKINTGDSICTYATSLVLTAQMVKLEGAYTFTGNFSGTWQCTDYEGQISGWSMYLQMGSELTNGSGNSIASTGVSITHSVWLKTWANTCKWGNSTGDYTAIGVSNSPYTLLYRSWSVAGVDDEICDVSVSNVNLKVDVPEFQAPGVYSGTFVVTVPAGM